MKSTNKKIFLIISLLILTSCGSFNPFYKNSGPASKEIGPEGGTITSADGRVTLTFPVGAVSQSEIISIEKINTELLGPEFDEVRAHFSIASAYELSPDGLVFDSPVYTTVISDQKAGARDGNAEFMAEILFSSSGGNLKVLENPGIKRSTGSEITVFGELTSFSKLARVNDVGLSVSSIEREEIEKSPSADKTFQSILTLAPNLNHSSNQPTNFIQLYQSPLGFIDATQISQIPTTTGDNDQFTRTFNYTCSDDGPALLITSTNFTFSANQPIDVLRNTTFNFENNQLVNCLLPEDSKPEYNFSITDLSGEFNNDISGRYTLSVSYKLDKEIADFAIFKINWGDGNENTYFPTAPETTRGQDVFNDNYDSENTYLFKASHQYKSPLISEGYFFNIDTEAWAFDSQNPERELEEIELTLQRRFSNNWQLFGHSVFDNSESRYSYNSTFSGYKSTNSDLNKPAWSLTPAETLNPLIIDKNLQIDFSDFSQSLDAYPLFSVDKDQIGDNSWVYHLDYSLDFAEQSNLTPSFSYSEFPQDNGIQPLQFDFDLTRAAPVIIQINDSNQPELIDNFDSYNHDVPTRIITTPVLNNYLKKFDAAHTTVFKEDEDDKQDSQSEPAIDWGILGTSTKVGAKLDWATRSSFKDAVCGQDGLVNCTVDGITPVLVLFGETSLFNWNLTEQGFGMVPISAGASLTLSQVNSSQNYAYGAASPLPYDISGQTGILGFDTYIRTHRRFEPILTLPGRPIFSPYVKIGMSNIWNCTDFKFMSMDETYDYHRKHHGIHFMGGLGTDINFSGPWGARFNLDYTAGGADANLRFGAGVNYTF